MTAIHESQPPPITRRHFFRECGVGLGKIALAVAAHRCACGRAPAAAARRIRSRRSSRTFPAKAKRVIHLFMAGAPSQLDLFDYKPELAKLEGKPLPPSVIGGQRYAFIRPDAAVLGPRFKFAKHGQSGAELSEMLPHLAKVVDDICLIKSVTHRPVQPRPGADLLQHRLLAAGPAVPRLVGALRPRRETQDLPAFVVMSTGSGISGGAANWSSGFLPTVYTGVGFATRATRSSTSPARRASTRSCSATRSTWSATLNRQRLGSDRRSGDRHAHRALRDGLPPADVARRS